MNSWCRPVAAAALLLVSAAASPRAATAQLCRGMPRVFVAGHRDDNGTLTGEVGVGPFGMTELSANVAFPDDPPNGSSSYSFGGRVYWGREEDNLGLCMVFGAQLGYAYLINADGLRMNARITSRSLPVGLGFGRGIPVTGGVRVMVFAVPQLSLRSREIVLYNRSDTTTTSSDRTDVGLDLGGGVQVGPLLVRGSWFRSQDVPWTWRLTVGIGR